MIYTKNPVRHYSFYNDEFRTMNDELKFNDEFRRMNDKLKSLLIVHYSSFIIFIRMLIL